MHVWPCMQALAPQLRKLAHVLLLFFQQALTDQLMDDSLLRLWKTGGDLCAPDPMDDDQTDVC